MPPADRSTLRGAALPPALSDLARAPSVLHVRGELPRGPAVAIVGTRHPTRKALRHARRLARALARRGVAIVSGGARGIDAAAHAGALDVGGITVVVSPSGLDRPYPVQHRRLYDAVVAGGGAVASSFDDDAPARPGSFFERNGVLVALAHAVVVVQAPLQSGARNAAKLARSLGRPLFVVPSAPWVAEGLGCVLELQLGAIALHQPEEVLQRLKARNLYPAPARPRQLTLDELVPNPPEKPGLSER